MFRGMLISIKSTRFHGTTVASTLSMLKHFSVTVIDLVKASQVPYVLNYTVKLVFQALLLVLLRVGGLVCDCQLFVADTTSDNLPSTCGCKYDFKLVGDIF